MSCPINVGQVVLRLGFVVSSESSFGCSSVRFKEKFFSRLVDAMFLMGFRGLGVGFWKGGLVVVEGCCGCCMVERYHDLGRSGYQCLGSLVKL